MLNRKAVISLILGWLTLVTVVPSYALDFFSTERFDEAAALPGSSLGAPSGMVSSWGSYFAAVGGLTHSRYVDRTDGSLSFGMGLGDSIKSIGATVTLNIGSINFDEGQGERGAFNLSIGKFFTDWQLGIAVGGVNVGGWNRLTTKPKSSSYLALTKILPFNNHPVIVNIGVGTNAFADISVFSNVNITNPEDEVAGFIGVGVYLSPQISLIVDYTSGILAVGTSMAPIDDLPLVVTLGGYDVNKVVPNHDKVSFVGSVAYSFSF